MQGIYEHPKLGKITVSQSARSRRVSIAVKPSGEVRLSFPKSVSLRRALEFVDTKIDWITAARQRMAEKAVTRPSFTPQQLEELRSKAKEILPAKVSFFAQKFGFRYGRVIVRATRSKWGSCSPDNNISLSIYLMTVPEHLADYVIIHELCHTVHHNHSPRFHALLDSCLGGCEKELRRELRSYSTGSAAD